MTQLDFISGMKRLSSYYFKDLTTDQLVIWYDMFKDVNIDDFNQAIKELSRESQYMPNANILLEKCSQINIRNISKIVQFMYEDGYFKVEPAAEFEKEVAAIFFPVENRPNVVEETVILEYLQKGNRAAIKKLIEGNDVNKDNVILIARENIGAIPTSMVRDLEKILSVELTIENESADEQ